MIKTDCKRLLLLNSNHQNRKIEILIRILVILWVKNAFSVRIFATASEDGLLHSNRNM
jgi:hypothetical protein